VVVLIAVLGIVMAADARQGRGSPRS
jgi:hypothetical protein